jgi:hypothetical protein
MHAITSFDSLGHFVGVGVGVGGFGGRWLLGFYYIFD